MDILFAVFFELYTRSWLGKQRPHFHLNKFGKECLQTRYGTTSECSPRLTRNRSKGQVNLRNFNVTAKFAKESMMEPPPQGEVEDTLKRITSHPGVLGLVVLNPLGIAIKTTMDNATTQLYATNFTNLTNMARSSVRDLDPLNDLKFLRVRSRKYEIMVAPCGDLTLIVIQNPNHREV
ncbi:dynein light chain roadblock-type 2-like [Montipora foliosa]|uniref:dynein light chain roadblock-type 2-like n=1 Tax=Montipora foliosa TaxID=591990 RepID=UPI0035F1477E